MTGQRRVLPALEARPHLTLPVHRDRQGLTGPTPAETRGPHWRRTGHNNYVPADVEQTSEQRIVQAAAVLPPHGAVTGWAALHWEGATRWFSGLAADGGSIPVCLAIGGENIRPQPGILVSEERLDPRDIIVADGIRVTTAVRSTCFEMRYARDERHAGLVLSMAAYDDLVSRHEMAEYAWEHNGWTGVPQCRAGTALADENCWSPTEFEMAMIWQLDAGLPPPLLNRPVFDPAGNHVGTPDLLDVEAGVVGQYDGALHLTGSRRAKDIRAEGRYRDLGLECFTMTAADRPAPAVMAQRMLTTRRRARWEAESRRAWTVVPPPWWIPTHTVALRRALDEEQRRRFLGYRSA